MIIPILDLLINVLSSNNNNNAKKSWWVGEWRECSGTCANGGKGYKKRSVLCVRQRPNEFDESKEIVSVSELECDLTARPSSIESCHIDMSKCGNKRLNSIGYWITEEWNRV